MKNLLCSVLAAWAMVSCGGNGKSFILTGTIAGAEEGDTVKLVQYDGNWDTKVIDEAVIEGGRFTFEGRQDTADFYVMTFNNGKVSAMADFLLENGKFEITLTPDSYYYELKGTPLSEAWARFRNGNERLCAESMDFYHESVDTMRTEAEREEARLKMKEKEDEIRAFRLKFVEDNITNVAGANALVIYSREFSEEETARLADLVPEDCTFAAVRLLKGEVASKRATAVGQPYTDFSMPAADGGTLSVSDVVKVHKVTMIDFWASWCGPCRAEMPAVKAAYARYHDKGFEIVGVSLDNVESAWLGAIRDLGLEWPQMSDLKGWECAGAQLYGVKAIPATVLIVDGKIVARNLRGDAIAEELAMWLGN